MLELSTPVKFVKRVGERVADELRRRGVETVEDLLYHLPFRYEDRLNPRPIAELTPGEMASVIGEVRGTVLLKTRGGPIFEMTVGQGTSSVKCIWFHGSYLKDRFKRNQMVALYGQMDASRSTAGRLKMVQPQFEILPEPGDRDEGFAMLEVGRIVPVYESLGGTTAWGAKLTSRWLRRVMWGLFEDLKIEGQAPGSAQDEKRTGEIEGPRRAAAVQDSLPIAMLKRLELPAKLAALRAVHFPEAGTSMDGLMGSATPGHRRLIFEEFFYLELGLELKRRRMRDRIGTTFVTNTEVREALKQVLPFKPTAAQKRVLGEIAEDMRKAQPMRRLLQGDVGSGKTIVAMQAALVAIENGYQVAMMAPTEILATQHFLSARKLLAEKVSPRTGRPYRVGLLTGSLDTRAKREAQGRILRGETQLAIGTHALIEEQVEFENLGLVIVDEQHRFGVEQRFTLMRKPNAEGEAGEPDVLVMTATPIPRTLALTLYGDMDASVIDELPPGRSPIVTRRVTEEEAAKVWAFVRKQVAGGRQAYVVYPVIEGSKEDQAELDFAREDEEREGNAVRVDRSVASEKRFPRSARNDGEKVNLKAERLLDKPKLRAATEMYEQLRAGALQGLRLGLLHGRLSAADKEVEMRRFQRGDTDVLLATTVVEVGVDVPNATVMVVEHAERFGLAQMHQLRGRVGRGAAKSYCILMTGGRISAAAEERLGAMERTQDGFELAEIDLIQRGPGEFFGTRQAGMPELRVGNLVRDREVLDLAKREAASFAKAPEPGIPREEIEAVWERLKREWQRKYGLVEA